MRTTLLVVTCLSTLALATPPAEQPPAIVRGDAGRLGTIPLGLEASALAKLGFKPSKLSGRFVQGEPFPARSVEVQVIDSKVAAIDWPLTPAQASALTHVKSPTLEDVLAAVGRCGPIQVNEGATIASCEGSLMVLETPGGITLRLEKGLAAPASLCDAWVKKGDRRDVVGQQKVCLLERVLSGTTTLESVEKDLTWGACETVSQGELTTRRCRGTHLIFRAHKLVRIELQ